MIRFIFALHEKKILLGLSVRKFCYCLTTSIVFVYVGREKNVQDILKHPSITKRLAKVRNDFLLIFLISKRQFMMVESSKYRVD